MIDQDEFRMVMQAMGVAVDSQKYNDILKQFADRCPSDGCIQRKPNGKWGIISNKTGLWWNQNYDTKSEAEKALKAYHAKDGE